MKLLPLAVHNVGRNWHRSLVTTGAMSFAGFIMIIYASLMEGLWQASERNAVAMNLGDIQIHAMGYREDPDLYTRIEDAGALVDKLREKGFRAAPRLYGFGLAASGAASAGVQLRGIDGASEITVTEVARHVMEGSWLDEAEPRGVVIGKKLARTLGVAPGDELVIVGQAADGAIANDLYTVRGILKSVGEEVDRAGFYMLEGAFRELMVLPSGAHEIAIMRESRSADLGLATKEVAAVAAGYETLSWRQLRPVIARVLDMADASFLVMLLITYVAVAMVVLNAMLMSVFERIHELGVMKAIGVTPWQLTRLVYLETLVQVGLAAVVAVALGWPFASYLERGGIDLSRIASGVSFGGVAIDPVWRAHVTVETVFLPIVFLFVIALLAVIYPAVKAAVIQPVKAIYHR